MTHPTIRSALGLSVLCAHALACAPAEQTTPCNSARDCAGAQVCVEGLCRAATDAANSVDRWPVFDASSVDGAALDARHDAASTDGWSGDPGPGDRAPLDQPAADLTALEQVAVDGAPADVAPAEVVAADLASADLTAADRAVTDLAAADGATGGEAGATDTGIGDRPSLIDVTPGDAPADAGVTDTGTSIDAAGPDATTTDSSALELALHDATDPDSATTVAWWDPRWSYRQKLSFDSRALAQDLEGFTVLVALRADRFDFAHARSDGVDLRFVDADGVTVLPHEIEAWQMMAAPPTGHVWVRVPRIDVSSTTDHIWLYHGNPLASSAAQPAATWSAVYRAVWHLGESKADSTVNANHASATDITPGIGISAGCSSFDGTASALDVNDDASIANLFAAHGLQSSGGMVSLWARPASMGELNFGRLVDKSTDIYGKDGWVFSLYAGVGDGRALYFCRDSTLLLKGCASSQDDSVQLNTWQHLAVIFDDSTPAQAPRFFVDGRAVPLSSAGYSAPAGALASDQGKDLAIGNQPYARTRTFDGCLDEARLYLGTPSTSWVLAEYLSVRDQGFVVYGPEEPR